MNKTSTKSTYTEKWQPYFLLGIIIFLSRYLHSPLMDGSGSYDPSNILLAVQNYDLNFYRPQLPGYPLWVFLIRSLSLIFGDPHSVVRVLSPLFSAIASILFWDLSKNWFSKNLSLLITLLLFTTPLVWYYGTITEIYSIDLLFSILALWLALRVKNGTEALPILFAILGGFRPSSPVLLFPLYCYLWWLYLKSNKLVIGRVIALHFAAFIIILSWFLPMIWDAGGFSAYINLYKTHNPIPQISLFQNVFSITGILWTLILIIVPMSFSLIYSKFKVPCDKLNLLMMVLWFFPPLIFFTFTHFVKGYILLNVAPIFILLGSFVNRSIKNNKYLVILLLIQITYFLFTPYRLPHLDTIISKSNRKFSIPQVWLNRALTNYAFNSKALQSIDKHNKDISKLLKGCPEKFNKKHIWSGPTVPISIRSLQVEYPNRVWLAHLLYEEDSYEIHEDISSRIEKGVKVKLSESLGIERVDFINKYSKDLVDIIAQENDLALYFIPKENSEKFAERYKKIFSR